MSTESFPAANAISECFEAQAGQVAALIMKYHASIEQRPVMSSAAPGDVFGALPQHAPETAEPFENVLRDVECIIIPALTHWQHPMFLGYFPANASTPAMLADLLCAGFGVQGMLWQTSPACTELEMRVLDWLAKLIGLPESFRFGAAGASSTGGGGVIQGTASETTLAAMVAARYAHGGTDHSHCVVYGSTQAHSSIEKSAKLCGIAQDNVRHVPTTENLAMNPAALQEMIAHDQSAGRVPIFVCATLGTTSTGAFDPIGTIGPIVTASNAWLHIDAAWAGSAFVCEEFRGSMRGIEHAASFNFNPHKWLLTNFDCSTFWVNGAARRKALIDAMSIAPEYLRNAATESGEVVDYRDWHAPLGRRFRALKLWFVLRMFGAAGLRAHIRSHVEMAQWLEAQVNADERMELVMPRSLALVCIAARAHRGNSANELTRAMHDWLREDGRLFLTHTVVPDGTPEGRYTLRVAIGTPSTRQFHIAKAWDLLCEALENVYSTSAG